MATNKKRELASLVQKLKEDREKIGKEERHRLGIVEPPKGGGGWNPLEDVAGWLWDYMTYPFQHPETSIIGRLGRIAEKPERLLTDANLLLANPLVEGAGQLAEQFKENVAEPAGAYLAGPILNPEQSLLGMVTDAKPPWEMARQAMEMAMPPMPGSPEVEEYRERVPWLAREAIELPAWMAMDLPIRGAVKGIQALRGAKAPKAPKVKLPVRPTAPTEAVPQVSQGLQDAIRREGTLAWREAERRGLSGAEYQKFVDSHIESALGGNPTIRLYRGVTSPRKPPDWEPYVVGQPGRYWSTDVNLARGTYARGGDVYYIDLKSSELANLELATPVGRAETGLLHEYELGKTLQSKAKLLPTTPTETAGMPEGVTVRAGLEGAGGEAIPPKLTQGAKAAEEAATAARTEIATAEFDKASSDALIKSIRGAKKQRVSAMERQHAERQKRTAISATVTQREIEAGRVEGAFDVGARATGGELPKTRFFEPPGNVLTAEQKTSLFAQIGRKWGANPEEFQYWTGVATDSALKRVLEGEIPTFRQLELLRDMFGDDIGKAVLDKRPFWNKALSASMNLLHIPKSIRSSYDLSNAFRQSWFFTMNPMNYRKTMSAMWAQIKALRNENTALAINQGIKNTPAYKNVNLFDLAQKSKVDLIEIRKGVADLMERADPFMSAWAEHIPGIRQSQRAFITFSNKMRHDMFYKYARPMIDKGMTWETDGAMFQKLGEFMNIATGRGLLGKLESLGPELGLLYWSPRLFAARVELLPYLLFKTPPIVRKQLIHELVASTSATIGILTAMKMSGVADVELDPRSADFGKLRIGNTRIDLWGGFQQYAVFVARIFGSLPGIPPVKGGKSSTTGDLYDIDPIEASIRFMRYKTAPAPAFFIDLWLGENAVGEEMADKKAAEHAWEQLSPFVFQDIVDAYREEGTNGIFLGLPGIVGHGVTSYGPREKKVTYPPWR